MTSHTELRRLAEAATPMDKPVITEEMLTAFRVAFDEESRRNNCLDYNGAIRVGLEAALSPAFERQEPVAWPEPSKPINDVSRYDHIIAHGYRIEWKSWKENPGFTVEREPHTNSFIGCFDTLDEAKRAAERDMSPPPRQ